MSLHQPVEAPAEPAGDDENLQHFRDILLRLTFAAQGWDSRLDVALARLQDQLRGHRGLPNLKTHAETLYRALMLAEDNKPVRNPAQLLVKAFGNLPLPSEFQPRWQALMEEAGGSRNELHSLDALEQAAALLSEALKATKKTGAGRKPGLLASLFGNVANGEAGSQEFLKAVQHRLLELIGTLCPPPSLQDDIEALKEEVGGGLTTEKIPEILERINLLIQEIRGHVERERLELEKFLGQLTSRLTQIESALEATDDSTNEVFARRRELDAEIDAHTRDMAASARDATDLGALKEMVEQRVDTIRKRMEEHQQIEQKLVEQKDKEMADLKAKLNSLEEETQTLRTQVREERHQAFTDALTNLPNRFAYEERMAQEFERWQRYGSPLSLLIFDVDHFKRINDTYGHKAGDKALRIIAKELATGIRKTDFIGRYGGEEIVILMPETNAEQALIAAEKLRKKVEQCGFHFREKKVTITVSCGLSEFRQGDSPESAFERADKALYEAKNQGRNRCVAC